MTVVAGISMVKDEADIVGRTVAHMLGQVDVVLVADNASTDGTTRVLRDVEIADFVAGNGEVPGDRLIICYDEDPAYYQSRKMTHLAELARKLGADWVVPFDADEWWYSPDGRPIREVLAALPDHVTTVPAALYDHVATGHDSDDPDPVRRTGWRRRTALGLPKVACRTCLPVTIEAGNHGATYPTPRLVDAVAPLLEVRHFPYRSADQFLRKVENGSAAYRLTDLPAGTGAHWRQYGQLLDEGGPDAVRDWFREHFWVFDPTVDTSLVYDPAPGA